MSDRNDEQEGRPESSVMLPREGVVYVAPDSLFAGGSGEGVTLKELWDLLWSRKVLIIAIAAVCSLCAVAYVLIATEIYRAEVLLAPAKEQSSPVIPGQLGGLAALAGVSAGGERSVEALAVLGSRDFAREFISQYELLPVFFADRWDADAKDWLESDRDVQPDLRDGVKFFHNNVLSIEEERGTGLVTLAIEWRDPDTAARWAAALVQRINDRLRERALAEAQSNVSYLQAEMARTGLVAMQQSIGQLLQSELQKLMLARGNEEFAFRVVDPAVPPKEPERPKRALIVILGTLMGAIVATAGVLLVGTHRSR